jgi:chaperonin GroES
MRFRPLYDRVVVEGDVTVRSGIIIPDNARERLREGESIAAEPGSRDDGGKFNALAVEWGDIVLFGKWSGTEVTIAGEALLILKESDIMGIVERTEADRKKAA